MWNVVVSILIILISRRCLGDFACPDTWFDCGSNKCIAEIWVCDGENDCLNFKDEENCDGRILRQTCKSSQFQCISDNHCIPEQWYCDGESDCFDGSDETNCVNNTLDTPGECGFRCADHHCIPLKWHCDGNLDCKDGTDEIDCSNTLCADTEFICTSGSCVNQSLVCDGKNDCSDGSDEGSHCGDPCENTTCSQLCKSTPSGTQCYCNHGYTLDTKDNRTCLDIDECQEDGFCSHNCKNLPGNYECSCLDGYELDNRTCLAKGEDPLLLFSAVTEIRGLRLRSQRYFPVRKTAKSVVAVDADPHTGRIYWIEISNTSKIYSSKMDGTGMQTVLGHGLMIPEDIAVDYVTGNLYLTDSGLKQILACKVEGTMCTVLHKDVNKPRSIVVDPAERYMYWSDWGKSPGIFRSSMDGTRRTALVTHNVSWPNGIAIDHTLRRLYWADAQLYTIEYIKLDGSSRKVLLAGEVFHPYSLAVFEDTIYWTDWYTFSLESCNKFTGHRIRLMARESGQHLMGVHVYHPVLAARVANPCWSNDCSHMCLISQSRHFRCACPSGFSLSTDQKTCSMDKELPALFVTEGSSVFYIRPESVGNESISQLPLKVGSFHITKVAYDSREETLFIADVNSPGIHAVNMVTQHIWNLVKTHLISPEDLAFHRTTNNLYWVDSSKGTVEVISVDQKRRSTLVEGLKVPVAIAVSNSGFMFVATIGTPSITRYDMDGKNPMVLISTQSFPMSVAAHPTKNLLYWSDPRAGTISSLDFLNGSIAHVIADRLDGVMSVAVSDDYIYWTDSKRELQYRNGKVTHSLELPRQEEGIATRKVTYSPKTGISEISPCSVANGGCSYLCLASPEGKTCVCPVGKILAADHVTCMDRGCSDSEFKCISNGLCLPGNYRCDGNRDCEDGSDELGCETLCSDGDFKCRNGRCVLHSWRCDSRDDCGDNSDEQDCPELHGCAKDQILCKDGMCIPTLWRCDGAQDCGDGSDEIECHAVECDHESQVRCDNGQCVPISWVCDGTNDCFDGTDERNCSTKLRTCMENQFHCESDGSCMDNQAKCDGRKDCEDGSDEKNCRNSSYTCKTGMFHCDDGHCIYDYEVCDGSYDCNNSKDEENCTNLQCPQNGLQCKSPPKRCVPHRWICDGDEDCKDGEDEEGCAEGHGPYPNFTATTERPNVPHCDGFYCYSTGICLSWSRVCDGHHDCEDLPDEGEACKRPCTKGCGQICQRTPQGSICFCYPGYRLLPDNTTCDDIDECLEPGTCSHFCNNTRGGFKCNCTDGYFLHHDHRTCKADGGPATLVYLLGDQIRGVDLVSRSTRVYISVKNADMKGMDYDASQGLFYYSENNDGSINSYSPQTQRQDILVKLPLRPCYVRYDWIVGNLYYTDDEGNIGVCSRDGKLCSTILPSGVSNIESLDISPTTGYMFWTIWSSVRVGYVTGVIERADMDGSHRLVIISETEYPSSVTVDHVLHKIYWTDSLENTLESADFRGFNRRQIVEMAMYHPYAVTVFEDYVYWTDWGTNRIMRCNKFKGHDCEKIQEGNVKAEVLMIVHKVMQPNGTNRCVNSGCSQLCLPTRTSFTCKCADGYVKKNGTCTIPPTSTPQTSKDQCPRNRCLFGAKCIVVGPGEFHCECEDGYEGKFCGVKVAAIREKPYDYSWMVAVMFAVLVVGIIVIFFLLFKRHREKIHRVSESVSVKFRNQMSEGRSLVVDTDDGSACDEQLVLEHDGEYRHSPFGGGSYTLADTRDGNYKRWPSYDTQTIGDNIANFFGRFKRNNSPELCK